MMNDVNEKVYELPEELLEAVAGGAMQKPNDCGGNVDQYKVYANNYYYYHYTGGGHDTWLRIYVTGVFEESKGVLWFTERMAYVRYDNGMTGKLPLDTGDVYYCLSNEPNCCLDGGSSSPVFTG